MKRSFSQPQHEPQLSRGKRRAQGVFYTPVEIAEWIVQQTYGPLLAKWQGDEPPPRILDPACGAGVFLTVAARALQARCQQLLLSDFKKQQAAKLALYGIDIDPATVRTAHTQTKLPRANFECTDALSMTTDMRFAAIVGNPPYVSIRELAKCRTSAAVSDLRERFTTARGNFDLYVLFIERALQWLQPGGRLGFIIPNKWATLDYAQQLREMLLQETTLEQIVDLSSLRVFPQAGTYPQIITLEKRRASADHRVQISRAVDGTDEQRLVLQRELNARGLVLGNEIRVEDRVPTVSLSAVATLHSGASGYSANELAAALVERADVAQSDQRQSAEFIVSGNIDRYAIELGDVRFLNRRWNRPALPLDSNCLTSAKRKLYREPKIVLSGMSRRLEAAYDEVGCALGVQVYAASQIQIDPLYLLGVLNSKLLTYLFRERFGAKRLAGGYFSLNKGQLAQLPIRQIDPVDRHANSLQRQIRNLATQLQSACAAELDQQLDELVYRLYGITAAEQKRIEASFVDRAAAKSSRRAA